MPLVSMMAYSTSFAGVEAPAGAQGFEQVVDVHIELFEDVGEQIAALDDDDGLAVEQFPKAQAARGELGDDDVHHEEGEHGDDAVDYGDGGIAHRDAGKVARHQRDGELERLQFAELPLAHQPHGDEQEEIDDDAPDKEVEHGIILPPAPLFIRTERGSVPPANACAAGRCGAFWRGAASG